MRISPDLSDEAVLRELGERLASARLARDLTQAAVAEEAGVSKRTIERLESGQVASRLSAFVRVCRVLGLLERLDALVPPPSLSPVDQLKLAGHRRQRASGSRVPARSSAKRWVWGDES
jgi:transcriptional regulator with XRE-family HTH domain